MNNQTIIQAYINSFRKILSPYVKPGIGMTCNVLPANDQGAILEFVLGLDIKNEDIYKESEPTINVALKKINQHMIGGNIENIHFGGTNISLEGNRIILIKAEDRIEEWDEKAAQLDASRIIRRSK